jgi:small subunit ribosomal protein S9
VFLRSGKGTITINGRPLETYFTTETSRAMVRQPLLTTETAEKFDVLILADGGGYIGQAGAPDWALRVLLSSLMRSFARA